MAEEKKTTGIDAVESGFVKEPELSPAEQIEADSYVVSESELEAEMKAAGMPVPEKKVKEPAVPEGAINQEEEFFAEIPELSPIEQISVDEPVVSQAEMAADLEAAGIAVPEQPAKEKKAPAVPEGAINQEKEFFAEMPELSPIEQLEADEAIVSPAELEAEMKKAGLK